MQPLFTLFLLIASIIGRPQVLPLISKEWSVSYPVHEQTQVFCRGYYLEQPCIRTPPIPGYSYIQLMTVVPGNLTLTHNFIPNQKISRIQLNFLSCNADSSSPQSTKLSLILNNTTLLYSQECGINTYSSQSVNIFVSNNPITSISLLYASELPPIQYPSIIVLGQILIFE